jgi:hypothetical protein
MKKQAELAFLKECKFPASFQSMGNGSQENQKAGLLN